MTISRSLELPDGYQRFSPWYTEGEENHHGVWLNNPDSLQEALDKEEDVDFHLYTQHQIFLEDGLIKQTRSSPNWEGGMVTYATCKHNMRTYKKERGWEGLWIGGLCPVHCADNCLLFVGKVWKQFPANYVMRGCLKESYPEIHAVKMARTNPRGDLYTPKRRLLNPEQWYDHRNFLEPRGHTRSVEFYRKSPGSVSEREDGLIPKWWRDLEYMAHGRRPPVFILSPCWLFNRPMIWTTYNPQRATLRITPSLMLASLGGRPQASDQNKSPSRTVQDA